MGASVCRSAGVLLLAAWTAGCPRLAAPGKAQSLGETGTACGADDTCESRVCHDGVCCQQRCGAGQTCADPVAPGQCVSRRGLRDACQVGPQCLSGACVEGPCCEAACAPSASCRTPGREGQCVSRALGTPCASPELCPTGWCVDGVCCDSACDAPCHACALAGSVGTCRVADDNTDPRRACAALGPCKACIVGTCGVALQNTDPSGSCGEGQVCSATAACRSARGVPCVEPPECASGACLAGHCADVTTEFVGSSALRAGLNGVHVAAMAMDDAGDLTLVVEQSAVTIRVNTREWTHHNPYALFLREHGSSWVGFTLLDCYSFSYAAVFGVAAAGTTAEVAFGVPVSSGLNCDATAHVSATLVGPSGQRVRTGDVVADLPDDYLDWVTVAGTEATVAHVAYALGSTVELWRREAGSPSWVLAHRLPPLEEYSSDGNLVIVGDRVVLVDNVVAVPDLRAVVFSDEPPRDIRTTIPTTCALLRSLRVDLGVGTSGLFQPPKFIGAVVPVVDLLGEALVDGGKGAVHVVNASGSDFLEVLRHQRSGGERHGLFAIGKRRSDGDDRTQAGRRRPLDHRLPVTVKGLHLQVCMAVDRHGHSPFGSAPRSFFGCSRGIFTAPVNYLFFFPTGSVRISRRVHRKSSTGDPP